MFSQGQLPVRIRFGNLDVDAFAKVVEYIYTKKFEHQSPPLYPQKNQESKQGEDNTSFRKQQRPGEPSAAEHPTNEHEKKIASTQPLKHAVQIPGTKPAYSASIYARNDDLKAGLQVAINMYFCAKKLRILSAVSSAETKAIFLLRTAFLQPSCLTGIAASLGLLFEGTKSGSDSLHQQVMGLCIERPYLCSANSALSDLLESHEPTVWKLCMPKLRQAQNDREKVAAHNGVRTNPLDNSGYSFSTQPKSSPATTFTLPQPIIPTPPSTYAFGYPMNNSFDHALSNVIAAKNPFVFGAKARTSANTPPPPPGNEPSVTTSPAQIPPSNASISTAVPGNNIFGGSRVYDLSPNSFPGRPFVPPSNGTAGAPWLAVVGQEANGTVIKLMSISFMPIYSAYCAEELRLGDYHACQRYGPEPEPNLLFGSPYPISSNSGGLFGVNNPGYSGTFGPTSGGLFGPNSSGLYGQSTSGTGGILGSRPF